MTSFKRRMLWQVTGLVLLLLTAFAGAKDEVSLAGNDATRMALVQAVAEFGSVTLERTEFRTVDKVVLDNRIYSDKPPLTSLIAAAVYYPLHVLGGISFGRNYHLAVWSVNAAVNFLLYAGLFLLLFRHLIRSRCGEAFAFAAALAPMSASWVGSFGATLNNHNFAALTALAGLLWFGDACRRRNDVRLLAASGFAAGLTSSFDIPAGFLLCGVMGSILLVSDGRKLAYFVPAGLAGLLVMPWVNYLLYGTAMPLYLAAGAGTFQLDALFRQHNFAEYFRTILFGDRGLFSYHWALLAAIPAAVAAAKRFRGAPGANALWLFGAAMILFYGFCTNEYGGWAYGFRYLIPTIPPLFYLAACWIARLPRHRKGVQWVFVCLLAQGMVTAAAGAYEPWCNTFENFRTPPGNVHSVVRSPFLGNLLAWSYANDPESRLTKHLIGLYPRQYAVRYLYQSYLNSKNLPMLQILLTREGAAAAKGVHK